MARPRKNDHLKEDLLQKGIELFSEHGYHGTGLKKILDSVSIPKGSFYNYFESKEQFAAEVIEAYHRMREKQLREFLEHNTANPLDTIRILYDATLEEFFNDHAHRGCLLGNLSGEISGMSPSCQEAMHTSLAAWRGIFTRFIEEAQEQDLVQVATPAEVLADIVWTCWQGSLLQLKIDQDIEQARKVMNALLNTFRT